MSQLTFHLTLNSFFIHIKANMTRQAFIAFTFIAMIAIIILADSLGSAVAIVSLVASFFVICSIGAKMGRSADLASSAVAASDAGAPTESADTTHGQDEPIEPIESSNTDLFADSTTEESMYGSDYAQMRSYVTSYKSPAGTPLALKTASECVRDADTRVAQIGAQRTRDKASMDGAVVKDANYWRAWYGDELYQAEKAPWWGQASY